MAKNRIHPLTQKPINGHSQTAVVDPPSLGEMANPENRRAANLSYDAARDTDPRAVSHWTHADSLDADGSNSTPVRQKLANRSRHEAGSNGYYCGIIESHANMVVGKGPSLRMLTGNREFNQLVEREFFAWAEAVQLYRKLWCMSHAKTQDGEVFGVLQTNPGIKNAVKLDLTVIEQEQCQSLQQTLNDARPDGLHLDKFGNIVAYDILPIHPGSANAITFQDPVPVAAENIVHWFKLKRPSGHRGIPAMTSTLNVGAFSRRFREATASAAEFAATPAGIIHTQAGADDEGPAPAQPFTQVPIPRGSLMSMPRAWEMDQLKSEHPTAQYEGFVRQQVSETARPLSMPYNAAACDSSTYSFASGKLDFLMYRVALDVERQDCDLLVLNVIFAAWFREWTVVSNNRAFTPNHQWDWPSHPVIDSVQEITATEKKLYVGATTLRQVYSDQGMDYEDQLVIQAEDTFGEASEGPEGTIEKMRKINVLKTTPQHAIKYVAQLIGLETAPKVSPAANQPGMGPATPPQPAAA